MIETPQLEPRFNVAPTQQIWKLIHTGVEPQPA